MMKADRTGREARNQGTAIRNPLPIAIGTKIRAGAKRSSPKVNSQSPVGAKVHARTLPGSENKKMIIIFLNKSHLGTFGKISGQFQPLRFRGEWEI